MIIIAKYSDIATIYRVYLQLKFKIYLAGWIPGVGHSEWHNSHSCCPHMNTAIVKTVSVASRPDCIVFYASGLKQQQYEKKKKLMTWTTQGIEDQPVNLLWWRLQTAAEASGDQEHKCHVPVIVNQWHVCYNWHSKNCW